jgi:predicted amidohydrolase
MKKVNCDKSDCFGNKKGICTILETGFIGKCTYFKTREQVAEEARKTIERLNKVGRRDLIFEHKLAVKNK